MKLYEDIDRLLEGTIHDVDFDDVYGPKYRRVIEYDALREFALANDDILENALERSLDIDEFSPEELRQTRAFEDFTSEKRFVREYGNAEENGMTQDEWDKLYHLWKTEGYGGFEYLGRWPSAVDEFTDEYETIDIYDSLWHTDTMWLEARDRLLTNVEWEGSNIRIWRAMTVSDDWIEHLVSQGKHLGIYWSWDKKAAYAHWGSRGRLGHMNRNHRAKIQAVVDENAVNWPVTLAINADSLAEVEREIRLFKGSPVKIEKIWIDGEEVDPLPKRILRKTFKA